MASGPRLFTAQFLVLAIATSLYNGAFGALNALQPRYVVDVLGGTESTAGFVMGSMALTALVTRPWFGRVADRHGARRIIVLGASVAATGVPLLLIGDSVLLAVASRLEMGIGNAGVFTGATLLAMNLAPQTRRAEAAAYILVSVHVGIGLGPIAGERIRDAMSYDAAWVLVTAMIVVAALVASCLPHLGGDSPEDAPPAPLVARAAVLPGIVSLLGVFAFNGLLTFAPLYSREIGLDDAALVFTAASGTIIVMRLAFGRVPDRIGHVRAVTGALLITCGASAVVALWATPAGLYLGAALLAVGLSLQSPSLMSLTVERAPDAERGSAMATFTGFFDVANALVGPAVGLVVAGVGYRSAFLASGAMAFAGLVVLRLFLRPPVATSGTLDATSPATPVPP